MRAGRSLTEFQKAYGDKVRVVFKHFPLSFHKDAHLAAQASVEAQMQGKFWEYHDKLFANMTNLKRPNLEKFARDLGLDMAKFKKALDNKTHKSVVDADMQDGQAAGVGGTPTVYVNGAKANFKGWSFDKIKAYIDPILIKKGYKKSDLPTGPGAAKPKVVPKRAAPKPKANPNPWMSTYPNASTPKK